jgi:chemotaxis protein CheD
MAERFRVIGARPDQIEVKIFGGADVLDLTAERETVGARNAEAAVKAVEAEGLTVAASDLRGRKGRKILFNTKTGEVFLKRLSRSPTRGGE